MATKDNDENKLDEATIAALKQSKKKVHKKKVSLPCPKCNVVLNSKAAFKYHTKNDVCTRKRKRQEQQSLGMGTVVAFATAKETDSSNTSVQPVPAASGVSEKFGFRCPDCGNQFKSSKGLQYHVQRAVCARRMEKSAPGLANASRSRDGSVNTKIPIPSVSGKLSQQSGSSTVASTSLAGETGGSSGTVQSAIEEVKPLPGSLTCPTCRKVLGSATALKYHTKKRVCHKSSQLGSRLKRRFKIDIDGVSSTVTLQYPPNNAQTMRESGSEWSQPFMRKSPWHVSESSMNIESTPTPPQMTTYDFEQDEHWEGVAKELRVAENGTNLVLLNSLNVPTPVLEVLASEIAVVEKPYDTHDSVLYAGLRVNCLSFHPGERGISNKESEKTWLAIGTQSPNNQYHVKGKVYQGKNYIQIWEIERDASMGRTLSSCKLLVQHNGEEVLSLEWCPAPIETNSSFLGVLACAFADGRVCILRVPKWSSSADHTVKVVNLDDTVMFYSALESRGDGSIVSRLRWYPKPKELLLAGAVEDGTVCIWDMTGMLASEEFEFVHITLLPSSKSMYFHMVNARNSCANLGILDIAWCPENPNLIAATNQDNSILFWDIRRPSFPIASVSKRNTAKRSEDAPMTSICWQEHTDSLILGDETGTVSFLFLKNGDQHFLKFHDSAIRTIAINKECPGFIASVGSDGLVEFHVTRKLFAHNVIDGKVQDSTNSATHFGDNKHGTRLRNGITTLADCLAVDQGQNIVSLHQPAPSAPLYCDLWSGTMQDWNAIKVNSDTLGESKVQSLTCFDWGNTNNEQWSWAAWGGEDGLVRVTSVGPSTNSGSLSTSTVGEHPVVDQVVSSVQL